MAAVLAILGGSAVAAADEGWLVDFQAAKEKAAAEGKDIFMEFTGSDWCPPCIKFKQTVLDSEAFKTGAPGSYILLKLDNPRDKSKQSPEEIEQYKKLSAEFKITGVPTVILVDAKGRPFAKTVGYGGQEPEAYVKELIAKQEVRKTRDDRLAKAEKAAGVDKAKLLDEAISGFDAELALTQYREILDEIVKLDGDNAAGLKAKYEGVLNLSAIRASLQEVMRSAAAGGPEEAVKKIDELLAEKKPQGEGLQEALFVKAQLLFRADKAQSKASLIAAQKAAPESNVAKQIDRIIEQFFKDEAPEKGDDDKESKEEKKEDKKDEKNEEKKEEKKD